jgi:hypothetical protein
MRKRLEAIESELAIADPLKRLHLAQERIDLTEAVNATETAVDLDALHADFVAAAGEYGQRKSITYTAWREVGYRHRCSSRLESVVPVDRQPAEALASISSADRDPWCRSVLTFPALGGS